MNSQENDDHPVFMDKHRFHRRDAKDAEKYFAKTIKHFAFSASLQ
jgi:hypothetical protein